MEGDLWGLSWASQHFVSSSMEDEWAAVNPARTPLLLLSLSLSVTFSVPGFLL